MMKTTLFPTIPLTELKQKRIKDQSNSSKPMVLIVDDETIIADTLAAILSQHGFMAMVAYDGASALKIAEIVPPDLLLSDVVMPGLNGIDLAIAITRSAPACKVLLFSGQAATVSLLDSAGEEAADFTVLSKPIHPKDLLTRVSKSLQTPLNKVEDRSAQAELTQEIPA
jgi:DNA-binding NtrC family response regulator